MLALQDKTVGRIVAKAWGMSEFAVIPPERWESIVTRLIDAYRHGLSSERLDRDTGLWEWSKALSKSYEGVPLRGIYDDGESSPFERAVKRIEDYLEEFEAERASRNPGNIGTTVTEAVAEGITDARELGMIVLIDAAPGLGKTCGAREYLATARIAEGIDCNVWMIRLEEGGVAPLAVLCQIADEIVGHGNYDRRSVPAVSAAIRRKTEGKGGVLIVDEAQGLAQEGIQGPKVFNCLRQFTGDDWGCFGIALLANGEVYRRYGESGKFTQLYRRVARRIEIFGLADAEKAAKLTPPAPALQMKDVRAVASQWGITDPETLVWCERMAAQPGALGHLNKLLMRARREYEEISREVLENMGVWS